MKSRWPRAAFARLARSTRDGSDAGGRSPGHSTPRSERGSDWRPRTNSDSGVPDLSGVDVEVLGTHQMYSSGAGTLLTANLISTMAPLWTGGDSRECGSWLRRIPLARSRRGGLARPLQQAGYQATRFRYCRSERPGAALSPHMRTWLARPPQPG